MLLLELMCSAVMIVAGINVFHCDDCCWNWCSRFVCCAAKFCFADATEPPTAIWYSLPIQLNLLQRIHIRWRFVCCAAKFCFADTTEPPAAIWYSLPICVLRSEILFRCRNWTCCSELIFAADLCVAQRNSVRQFVCCAAKLCFADATEPPAANWTSHQRDV